MIRSNAADLVSRQAADGASIGAEGLASLKMPVLLIGGENGPRIFAAMLGAAQKALPSAQRVTIPGAGHHVSRESAEAFARAVETFLAP